MCFKWNLQEMQHFDVDEGKKLEKKKGEKLAQPKEVLCKLIDYM